MSIFRDFGKASRGNAAPVTTALVVVIVTIFLLVATKSLSPTLAQDLVFNTSQGLTRPWTLFTYAFVSIDPINVALICLWLWSVGGAVERDLKPPKYLAVWLAISALSALSVWLGTLLLSRQGV